VDERIGSAIEHSFLDVLRIPPHIYHTALPCIFGMNGLVPVFKQSQSL
jgi:hypothetical protein